MVVSLLCVVCSALMAFMGTVIGIVKQEYSVEGLGAWGLGFYIMAAILAFVAVIELIRSIAMLHRRKSRLKDEEKAFSVLQFHNKRPINGIYVGGNDKKKGKSAGNTGKKYLN